MKKVALILPALLACNSCGNAGTPAVHKNVSSPPSPTEEVVGKEEAKAAHAKEKEGGIKRLTEEDYREVAKKLGVDVAAIKAVVEIEAGPEHTGFSAPGVPLINFDLSMFRKFASKNGINLGKYQNSHAVVFARPNTKRYGSQNAAQHARLKSARSIDNRTAIEGTFWGMFQIGGFNWKKCGAKDINDFVERMSRSERDQLDMFASFLQSSGLDKPLKNKDWAAFSKGYNGPGYAARKYHTRMAAAYARYKGK